MRRRGIRSGDDANWPFSARIAPDGTFAVGRSGTSLRAVALTGVELWTLKNVSSSGLPSISADGNHLVFSDGEKRLTAYDIAKKEMVRLNATGSNPVWDPRRERIAYENATEVSIYDVGSGSNVLVGQGSEPSWSPDGGLAIRVTSSQIDLIDVRTGQRRPLIAASTHVSVPIWSPGGEWMMYTRRGPRRWWSLAEWTGSEPTQVVIRHPKDGSETSIGEIYKSNPGDYAWVTSDTVCRARQ